MLKKKCVFFFILSATIQARAIVKSDFKGVAGPSQSKSQIRKVVDIFIFFCRCFHEVLDAILALGPEIIKLPSTEEVPPEIRNNSKRFPYFEHCIGAIDGTHIPVTPPNQTAAKPFRNRKGFYSQNVLAACSFNLKFVFVLAGWEGSASDSAVLVDAMSTSFQIPHGKYYLGDAGYGLQKFCLTPYRGVRYHLREWSLGTDRPKNAQELFNLRHSSLRNAIERIFGVLKKRFPILTDSTAYPYATQVRSFFS